MLWGKFLALSNSDRQLIVEATFWLIVSRLGIFCLPFRGIAPRLGTHMQESPKSLKPDQRDIAIRVSNAVRKAARHQPWKCTCLAQAMAGKAMLKRRGISNTLYLGVGRDENKAFGAHAWLRSGESILIGEGDVGSYAVVSTFADMAP